MSLFLLSCLIGASFLFVSLLAAPHGLAMADDADRIDFRWREFAARALRIFWRRVSTSPRAVAIVVGGVLLVALPALAGEPAAAPPAIITAIFSAIPPDVIVAVIGAVLVAVILPLTFKRLNRNDQDKIVAATKGLYSVLATIAPFTPTRLDDALAQLLGKVQEEMGRELNPAEKATVRNVALALQVDPTVPDLVKGPSPAEIARAINIPSPKAGV